MAFKEKSAWISLAAHGLIYGAYFAALAQAWDTPGREPFGAPMLFGAIVAFVVLMIALTSVAAIMAPKDATAPADEREQLIALKAERVGAYTLATAVVLLIGALLLDWNSFLVANLLLAAMVIAELAKAGAQIVYFRWSV